MSKLSVDELANRWSRTVDWLFTPIALPFGKDAPEDGADDQAPAGPQAAASAPAPGPNRRRRIESSAAARQIQVTVATLSGAHAQLKNLLLQPQAAPALRDAVIGIGQSLSGVASRSPDSTLFHLMQAISSKHAVYSVIHSMQCAVACALVAERLGWSPDERDSLASAALTMNISISRLQGELAAQGAPPSAEQRQAIAGHPGRSAELLEQSGVADALWLRAVREHHETPDGKGYPTGCAAAFEPAEVLRHVDIFMAKLKSRANRKAISPQLAAREIFVDSGNSRIAAAVIKEFGIYPPGIFVRLANGELATVVARGARLDKPIVGVLVNRSGEAPATGLRRDTADPLFAVVSVVNAANVMAEVDPAKLYA